MRAHYQSSYTVAVMKVKNTFSPPPLSESSPEQMNTCGWLIALSTLTTRKKRRYQWSCVNNWPFCVAHKINQIQMDLDSEIDEQTLNLPGIPAGPVLWGESSFVALEDRIVVVFTPTTSKLEPCPSWMVKSAREGLQQWLAPIVNASEDWADANFFERGSY